VGTFAGAGLRAQPAVAPMGPPQGKWIRLAPLPQATGELLGSRDQRQGLRPQGLPARIQARPVSCTSTISEETRGRRRNRCRIRSTTRRHGAERKDVFCSAASTSFGWAAGLEPVNDSWEYDPATDSWQREPPMPTTRAAAVPPS